MDGQRRIPQSLAFRRRRALKWLAAREPQLGVRQAARAGAVLLLASSVFSGLVSGGHLQESTGKGMPVVDSLGYSADNISIAGLTHHQPQDVLSAIGVKAGQSLVWFSAEEARRSIEKLSWVQASTVERRFPNQLLISVSERVPFAVWQKGSDYTVIDRSGIAMGGVAIDSLKGLPMITGEGANLAAPALVDALQTVPGIMIRMHAAARIGERRWNIYLDDGLKIMLPEGEVTAGLRALNNADASMGLLSKGITSVDLRDPTRMVITKADEPQQSDDVLTGSTAKAKP